MWLKNSHRRIASLQDTHWLSGTGVFIHDSVGDFSHQLIKEVVRYPQPATLSFAPARRLTNHLTSSSVRDEL